MVKDGRDGYRAAMDSDAIYRKLQSWGSFAIRRLGRWEIRGVEAIPKSGPAILAANHLCYLDPPLVAASAPRPVRFVAKTELFAIPVLRRFLRWIGTIPVERSRPDVRAVRESLRVLERGELLGIFPEGNAGSPRRPRRLSRGRRLVCDQSAVAYHPHCDLRLRAVEKGINLDAAGQIKNTLRRAALFSGGTVSERQEALPGGGDA